METTLEPSPQCSAAGLAMSLEVARRVGPDAIAQVLAQWRGHVIRELVRIGDLAASVAEALSAVDAAHRAEAQDLLAIDSAARALAATIAQSARRLPASPAFPRRAPPLGESR